MIVSMSTYLNVTCGEMNINSKGEEVFLYKMNKKDHWQCMDTSVNFRSFGNR